MSMQLWSRAKLSITFLTKNEDNYIEIKNPLTSGEIVQDSHI